MICRVEMPANEQIFGRFYRWRLMHGSGTPGARSNLFLMPLLVLVAVLFTFGFGITPLLIGAVVLLAAIFFGYSLWMKPSRMFRSKAGAALTTEVSIFTEASFTRTVRSEEGGMPDNSTGNYSVLIKAVETNRDFYLFTSPAQAYLIDKEYFTKGSAEELRSILQKTMGAKFKGKK